MSVLDFWHCEVCGTQTERDINENLGKPLVCSACRKLTPVQRVRLRRKTHGETGDRDLGMVRNR